MDGGPCPEKVPLSGLVIHKKAHCLYENLMETEGKSSTSESGKGFNASKCRFESFKNRFCLHNVKLVGEAVPADHKAVRDNLKIIEEKKYKPQ